MTHLRIISISISRLAVSLLLCILAVIPADAQNRRKDTEVKKDTVALFRGFSV